MQNRFKLHNMFNHTHTYTKIKHTKTYSDHIRKFSKTDQNSAFKEE